ncbi:MAG: 30S ribosomal protein S16 [Planctomycetia bacterium]
MAVAIRMKRMGRKNRAFYRICATDRRSPRDGRVIEVLGTYDTSIPDTDARCALDNDRVQYWLGVGAQPSDAVRVLIKKYGANGTRLKEMEQARARLSLPKVVPAAGEPVFVPEPKAEPAAAVAAEPVAVAEAAAEAAAPVAEVASPAAEAAESQPEQA